MTRIAYYRTTDLVTITPIVDAANERYGSTYNNFGRYQGVSAMLNYRKTLIKIWTPNLTVQGIYTVNTSDEASEEIVNKGSSFVIQMNNNITITPTLSAEITGFYVSGVRQGYFVVKSFGNFSIGLRQTLLQNKMTLSLTVNDILYTSKEKLNARYGNVNYTLVSERDSRYVNLTLRYNFGSTTVRAARSKSTGIEDETSRAGGR